MFDFLVEPGGPAVIAETLPGPILLDQLVEHGGPGVHAYVFIGARA